LSAQNIRHPAEIPVSTDSEYEKPLLVDWLTAKQRPTFSVHVHHSLINGHTLCVSQMSEE